MMAAGSPVDSFMQAGSQAQTEDRDEDAAQSASGDKLTGVLLVEDNQDDARLVRREIGKIRSGRYNVTHAPSLAKALQYLAAGNFDVVLLDLALPGSLGLETLATIQAQDPNTPIVALSGLDNQELVIGAIEMGAQDFIAKDVMSAPLLERSIRYAIGRKRAEKALEQREIEYRTEREQTEERLRQVSAHGRLAQWLGERQRRTPR